MDCWVPGTGEGDRGMESSETVDRGGSKRRCRRGKLRDEIASDRWALLYL